MKQLIGKPVNFKQAIIGKIKHKSTLTIRPRDIILVTEQIPRVSIGFQAVLANCDAGKNIDKYKFPLVYGIENIQKLKDDDVVLIEPNGSINILYEKSSKNNVLLITQGCNCSCIMCPQNISDSEKDYGWLDLNKKLISLIDRKTQYLGITGGEPTLKKEDLLEIISDCKKRLPHTSLALLTNGMLLDNFDYVKKLVSIKHPDLTFQIPLYSDTDTEHNRIIGANGFYKTIKGIHNLALFKQKIEIRTVIHALTYKRLPNLAEFIYRNFPFANHVALMGLEVEGLAKNNIAKLWIDPHNYNDELEKAVVFLHRSFMNVSIYNHQLCILSKPMWPFAKKAISSWKNIYLQICDKCAVQQLCGGFFASSMFKRSEYLHPITKPV